MTLKISPTVQLSVGLVLLTLSILLVAQAIGLTPGINYDDRLYTRQKLAETIALQTTIALKRNDRFFVSSMFNQIVEQTPSIRSLGLRRSDTTVAYQTEFHERLWTLTPGSASTANEISIPLIVDGVKQATLELTFGELEGEAESILGIPKFIWLLVFICGSGFLTFSIYLRRSLKQLDPSSVVPARVRNALNTMAEGVVILDKRHQIILANESFVKRFNTDENKLVGRKAETLGVSLCAESGAEDLPWQSAQVSGQKQMKVRMESKINGSKITFNVNSVPIIDERNKKQGTINSFDDITEIESKSRMLQEMLKNLVSKQKSIEIKNQELNHLATRDPLTDVFNRRYLFNSLEEHFAKANAFQADFCVIMLDIDHFKRINDTFGHNIGDVVIQVVCERVQKQLRQTDLIARFGGEEFCILLRESSVDRAMQLAEKCRQLIADETVEEVNVTASFGVTTLLYGAKTPNDLILQADQALYASKNQGRNRVTLWSRSLASRAKEQSQARMPK